MEQRWAD